MIMELQIIVEQEHGVVVDYMDEVIVYNVVKLILFVLVVEIVFTQVVVINIIFSQVVGYLQ